MLQSQLEAYKGKEGEAGKILEDASKTIEEAQVALRGTFFLLLLYRYLSFCCSHTLLRTHIEKQREFEALQEQKEKEAESFKEKETALAKELEAAKQQIEELNASWKGW